MNLGPRLGLVVATPIVCLVIMIGLSATTNWRAFGEAERVAIAAALVVAAVVAAATLRRSLTDPLVCLRRLTTELADGRISREYPGAWGDLAASLNGSLDELQQALDRAEASERRTAATNHVLGDALNARDLPSLVATIKQEAEELVPGATCHLIRCPGRRIPEALNDCLDEDPRLGDGTLIDRVSVHVDDDGAELLVAPVEDVVGVVAHLAIGLAGVPENERDPLSIAFGAMARTLSQTSRRLHAESRFAHGERHDSQTGLPNEVALHEWLGAALASPDRATTSLLIVEPQRTNGRPTLRTWEERAAMLVAVAQRIRSALPPSALVARVSGNEFAIAQTGGDPAATARRVADLFTHPISVGVTSVPIAVACGFATAQHAATSQALLSAATTACEENEPGPNNSPTEYHPALRAALVRRDQIHSWLERVAAEGEGLELWLQQIFEVRTRAVAGFEALARGRRNGELVPPGEFIPLAEETGLIDAVGRHMLSAAIDYLHEHHGARQSVAVNVSPVQLRNDEIVDFVSARFSRLLASPSRLHLEITESALVDTDEAVIERLHALRQLGIRIAIDDFGTGYSGLSYLSRLPVDIIKLDRSFVSNIETDTSSWSVATHTIELAHELGAFVVAEGVETEAQLDVLADMGCDRVQGFLLGRPQPVAHFSGHLAR